MGEKVHAAAEFARERLGVPERDFALGRVTEMRHNEATSDRLRSNKPDPGAFAGRFRLTEQSCVVCVV
jgi:hypothetical protein